MARNEARRATTLSISLSPELAAEVAKRVQGGLYSSASELFREALRRLIQSEAHVALERALDPEISARRFREASKLMDLGLAMRADKVRSSEPGLTPEEQQARLDALDRAQELGPGLRHAPERLRKLKLPQADLTDGPS